MKHFRKALLLILLVLAVVVCLAACKKDDEGNGGNGGNNGGTGGDNPPTVIGQISVKNVTFGGRYGKMVVKADGNYHTMELEKLEQDTDTERYEWTFEYWNADMTEKVADQGEGVKDPGTYIVKAICTDPKGRYSSNFVTAKLIIDQSFKIHYNTPKGAVVADANPELYSLTSEDQNLSTASLDGYKFKGWYDNAAYTGDPITTLYIQRDYADGGDIHLYGKFLPYSTAPTAYTYTTDVTEAPTTLPPIPGFHEMSEDAVCIIDVSQITEEALAQDSKPFGFKYSNTGAAYYGGGGMEAAIPAEGGGYGLEWNNYHYIEGSTDFVSNVQFQKPISTGYSRDLYDTLEFWIYSANATEQAFTIFLGLNNAPETDSLTFTVKLNFSGWKKFSVLLSGSSSDADFYTPARSNGNITEFRIFGCPVTNMRSDKANLSTEAMKDVTNFIFFSNFYVTTHKSSYPTFTNVVATELLKVTSNMTALTVNADKTDAEIDAFVAAMNLAADNKTVDPASSKVFSDIDLESTAACRATYERLRDMAEAWNDTSSKHYNSDTLRDAVVAGMNYLAEQLNLLVKTNSLPSATDDDITAICLAIADVMNLLGDRLCEKHAQAWGQYPLYFYPGATGDSTDGFIGAYVFTTVQIGLGNVREAATGMKQLHHLFTNNEIAVTSDDVNVIRYFALVNAMNGTGFHNPYQATYIKDLFAWFYSCVDAFTVNGKIPTALASDYDIAPYIRAMLMIYDMADTKTQQTFAGYVKYYLASDATLADRLAATQKYDLEADVLARIQASDAPVATPSDTACSVFDVIGTALYKNGDKYLLITPNGVYAEGINADAIDEIPADDTFFGIADEKSIAIIRGDQVIVIQGDTVQVSSATENTIVGTDNKVAVLTTDGNLTDDLLYYTSAPVIVLTNTAEDGSITFTVYNFTKVSVDFEIDLNGLYSQKGTSTVLRVEADMFGEDRTVVTFSASTVSQTVYTFTIMPTA